MDIVSSFLGAHSTVHEVSSLEILDNSSPIIEFLGLRNPRGPLHPSSDLEKKISGARGKFNLGFSLAPNVSVLESTSVQPRFWHSYDMGKPDLFYTTQQHLRAVPSSDLTNAKTWPDACFDGLSPKLSIAIRDEYPMEAKIRRCLDSCNRVMKGRGYDAFAPCDNKFVVRSAEELVKALALEHSYPDLQKSSVGLNKYAQLPVLKMCSNVEDPVMSATIHVTMPSGKTWAEMVSEAVVNKSENVPISIPSHALRTALQGAMAQRGDNSECDTFEIVAAGVNSMRNKLPYAVFPVLSKRQQSNHLITFMKSHNIPKHTITDARTGRTFSTSFPAASHSVPQNPVLFYDSPTPCCGEAVAHDWAHYDPVQDWNDHANIVRVSEPGKEDRFLAYIDITPDAQGRMKSVVAHCLANKMLFQTNNFLDQDYHFKHSSMPTAASYNKWLQQSKTLLSGSLPYLSSTRAVGAVRGANASGSYCKICSTLKGRKLKKQQIRCHFCLSNQTGNHVIHHIPENLDASHIMETSGMHKVLVMSPSPQNPAKNILQICGDALHLRHLFLQTCVHEYRIQNTTLQLNQNRDCLDLRLYVQGHTLAELNETLRHKTRANDYAHHPVPQVSCDLVLFFRKIRVTPRVTSQPPCARLGSPLSLHKAREVDVDHHPQQQSLPSPMIAEITRSLAEMKAKDSKKEEMIRALAENLKSMKKKYKKIKTALPEALLSLSDGTTTAFEDVVAAVEKEKKDSAQKKQRKRQMRRDIQKGLKPNSLLSSSDAEEKRQKSADKLTQDTDDDDLMDEKSGFVIVKPAESDAEEEVPASALLRKQDLSALVAESDMEEEVKEEKKVDGAVKLIEQLRKQHPNMGPALIMTGNDTHFFTAPPAIAFSDSEHESAAVAATRTHAKRVDLSALQFSDGEDGDGDGEEAHSSATTAVPETQSNTALLLNSDEEQGDKDVARVDLLGESDEEAPVVEHSSSATAQLLATDTDEEQPQPQQQQQPQPTRQTARLLTLDTDDDDGEEPKDTTRPKSTTQPLVDDSSDADQATATGQAASSDEDAALETSSD